MSDARRDSLDRALARVEQGTRSWLLLATLITGLPMGLVAAAGTLGLGLMLADWSRAAGDPFQVAVIAYACAYGWLLSTTSAAFGLSLRARLPYAWRQRGWWLLAVAMVFQVLAYVAAFAAVVRGAFP